MFLRTTQLWISLDKNYYSRETVFLQPFLVEFFVCLDFDSENVLYLVFFLQNKMQRYVS